MLSRKLGMLGMTLAIPMMLISCCGNIKTDSMCYGYEPPSLTEEEIVFLSAETKEEIADNIKVYKELCE